MGRPAAGSRPEQHWRELMAQWRQSGLPVRVFCRRQGVAKSPFYRWRRRLEQPEGPKAALLPVRITHEEKALFLPVRVTYPDAAPTADAGVDIVLANGRCVRVRTGFDHATLVQVVDLLDEGGTSC